MILSNLYKLSIGNGFGEWRQAESQELSRHIQNEFHKRQNPQDCDKAKKMVCEIRDKDCGFVFKMSLFNKKNGFSLHELKISQIKGLDVKCIT